ncbi:VOC family protein [Nonomuraea sp. NPDC049695]|uniref:VOC family protein n=1 Tax=Nonomuraea sp. NPDC049695 TaxID=3154734 RepID=UPI0034307DE3
MSHPFVFMDLRTPDRERSRRFYGELLGWTVTDVPAGSETVPMFTDGGAPWGGLTQLAENDGRRPQWIPYVPVVHLDRAVEQAVELGATVVRARVDLHQGSVTVIDDPTGATLALWEARR